MTVIRCHGYIGAQAVVSGVVALFTKLREGVGDIVKFELANSRLAAILGNTSDKVKELTADAQRLGATTKYTASEATDLQIELAKLGFTRKEILDATEHVLKFAQATGAELADAASLAGASLRMFNADTRETERYVSAMAVATTKSALSFSYRCSKWSNSCLSTLDTSVNPNLFINSSIVIN